MNEYKARIILGVNPENYCVTDKPLSDSQNNKEIIKTFNYNTPVSSLHHEIYYKTIKHVKSLVDKLTGLKPTADPTFFYIVHILSTDFT